MTEILGLTRPVRSANRVFQNEKNSCPQCDLNVGLFAYETNSLSVALLVEIRHGPFDIQGGGGKGLWFLVRAKIFFFAGPSGQIIFFIIESYIYNI